MNRVGYTLLLSQTTRWSWAAEELRGRLEPERSETMRREFAPSWSCLAAEDIASSKGWPRFGPANGLRLDEDRWTDKHLLLTRRPHTVELHAYLVCGGALSTNTLPNLLCYTPRASDWQHRSSFSQLTKRSAFDRVQKFSPMRGGCTVEEIDG